MLAGSLLVCPQCDTSSATNPRLVLRYSSCCGHCLCEDCVELLFAHCETASSTVPCPSCHSHIAIKDFDLRPIATQLFNRELTNRRAVLKLLRLMREDFASENEYNDFLEFQQDVVLDLTEGSNEEQKEAEDRLAAYVRVHQGRIERSQQRRETEARIERAKAENGMVEVSMDDLEDVGEFALVPASRLPNFVLPSYVLDPNASRLRALDKEIAALSDGEEKRVKMAKRGQLEAKARVGGGFQWAMAHQRELEEMREGWL